jgi:hypothetical protein
MRRPSDSGWRPSFGQARPGNACLRGALPNGHELIKRAVLDQVRQFYWRGIASGVVVYDELAYSKKVLAKAPCKFRGRHFGW